MSGYRDYFEGKRITLMGLGLLGRGVGDAQFLAECGATLIVTDLKDETELSASIKPLQKFSNITFHLGGHSLEDFRNRDLIIKAAGVPLDSPFIAEAEKNHIPVRMSADLFAQLAGIPVIGITGTRGKSTTTHMIVAILESVGMRVLLGGNVRGVSTLSLLPQVTENTIAVLELDSWQLQGFGAAKISPQVAVFTTFYPDHLNYYKNDLETYFADKAKVFLHQSESDIPVLGEQVESYIKKYGYQNKIRAHVVLAGSDSLPKNTTLAIPGEHNRYDAALAFEAARALGVDDQDSQKALESFTSISGRLQFVREVRGIKIYNDNNATTPEATLAALHALGDEHKKNIILIMGGSEKNLDMEPLLNEISKDCKVVLLLAGAGTERIKNKIPNAKIYDAMAPAVNAAMGLAVSGDILLMSPAFASFGMFKNEYDRGDQFDEAAAHLS